MKEDLNGSGKPLTEASPPKKTALEFLRDQHSAALERVTFYQGEVAKFQEQINVIRHKERGLEVGFVVKNRDGVAVVHRLNQYWIWGRFLKKDGQPGKAVRNIYEPFKVVAESLDAYLARNARGEAASAEPLPNPSSSTLNPLEG